MPVYSDIHLLGEIHSSRVGTAFRPRGGRDFNQYFKVWTSNPFYGPNEICTCRGLPAPYQLYVTKEGFDTDINAVCVESSAALVDEAKDDNRYIWLVTCKFSVDVPEEGIPDYTGFGNDPFSSGNLPWLEPPVIEWDDETVSYAPQRDLQGRPYLNSAGVPFTPAFTIEAGRNVLVVIRNEATFDDGIAGKYAFCVNSVPFLSALPGCAQLMPIRAKQMFRGLISYYRCTYRIRFGRFLGPGELNPTLAVLWPILTLTPGGFLAMQFLQNSPLNRESFQPYLLDAGLTELRVTGPIIGGNPTPTNIYFPGSATPISQPVPLNGSGQRALPMPTKDINGNPITVKVTLVDGTIVTIPVMAVEPTYLYFNQFQSFDLNPILQNGLFS
jgi:hypothetical protein